MTGTILAGILAAFAAGAAAEKEANAEGVNVGISIGSPAPSVIVAAPPASVIVAPPPRMVAPPQVVTVSATGAFYAPHASFNLFVYSGSYYSFHNGVWFQSTTYNGPWVTVATERVPRAVLGVPVTYYKIPPGHAKKHAGPHAMSGHGKNHKAKKDKDD